MRDAALRIIREIGVDTGGSNIQFAVDPDTGRMVVIEMNPRVSRSSALASKATGFPIAKIAARLAVGYRLDEIPNDITRMTPACFEPTIDYVVTKIPRFTFEKFRGAADELGPQMKSVGEAMAIGRTFKESLQKAMRSLEIGSYGLESRAAGMRESAALADGPRPSARCPTASACITSPTRCASGIAARGDPCAHRDRPVVYRRDRRDRRGRGANQARVRSTPELLREAKAMRLLRSPNRRAYRPRRSGGALKRREARGDPPGVQDRRHLRRRVRGLHAVPLFDLRRRGRSAARRSPQGDDSGRRPEPHRAGNRVRLLLRAREPRAQGRRLRDHHGQLQSRRPSRPTTTSPTGCTSSR